VATLLRYFDSKERLALYPWYHSLERFRGEVHATDRKEGGLVLWRRWVETEAKRHPRGPGSGVEIRRFVQASPELVARILAIHQELEDLLAEALAKDAGTDPATDLTTAQRAWRADGWLARPALTPRRGGGSRPRACAPASANLKITVK
jgi:hypothetical protein